MPNDKWGEPIQGQPRSFSLAALFRVITIVAVLFGWMEVLRGHFIVATLMLLGISIGLALVAANRQRGSSWGKLGTGLAFFFGVALVGTYIASLYGLAVVAAEEDLMGIVAACYLVVALPPVGAILWLLVRAWLHLAADAREHRSTSRSL